LDESQYDFPTEESDFEEPQPTETEQLQGKVLRLMDFDTIREQLANNATFFGARQMALNLMPSFDELEVEELQNETADASQMLEEIGDVSLESNVDTSESVSRAALGGILTGLDLLAVAESLEVHRRARTAALRAQRQAPLMADIARVIPDLQELQRQVRSKIGRRGEVVDNATPSLRALRTQVRQAYEKVTDALNSFIQSTTGRNTLQDPVISVRGDRLVVPVKAEMRHRVSGIVHDASNTGATLFIEPMASVELCNNWRELVLEEEREVTRVLRDLATLVGAVADDIRLANTLTAKLDFALARARYSRRLQAVKPITRRQNHPNESGLEDSDSSIRLIRARHPLLGRDAVPLTINIGPGWSALVITGPNTGGKTVAMKTVGLLALMHQSGIHIPAEEGSALPVFDGVFADIGDQQSIADSVSTFGSHIGNVIQILKNATSRTLVLLDELGNSTDPEEGSALAKAIIGNLAERGVPTIVTTHHRNVAAFAEANPHTTNGSFQLDPDTLEPTYQLTMGVPGRSYAMAVAERLGLPEAIMAKSRELLEPQHMRFEDWLNELQSERHQLQSGLEDTQRAKAEAESLRNQLNEQVEYLVGHRDDILNAARQEIMSRFDQVRQKLKSTEASLSWATPAANPPEQKERFERIRRDLAAQELEELPAPAPVRIPAEPQPISVGDTVFVRGLNLRGAVTELSTQGNEAEIAIGNVRINVDLHRLNRVDEAPQDKPEEAITVSVGPPVESMEIDIRGTRAAEGIDKLETFLDHATRDGLIKIRVIHGRGTGALRQAVREHLDHHPLVENFGVEHRERGGNGATWVDLR
jgi:DNA mismatch repair protein MutS2